MTRNESADERQKRRGHAQIVKALGMNPAEAGAFVRAVSKAPVLRLQAREVCR